MQYTTWTRGLALAALAGVIAGCGPDGSTARDLNEPAVIDDFSTDSDQLKPGQTATLSVEAHDPDGDGKTDAGDAGLSGLQFAYEVDNENWMVEGDGPSATLTAPDAYATTTTVTVTVTDPEGQGDSESLDITIGENAAPSIGDLVASPNPAIPQQTITLTGSATDENGDELTYTWSTPEAWPLTNETGQSVEVTAPDKEGARGTARLTVSDGYGGQDTARIELETSINNPPSISSMRANPPQVAPAGTSTVKVSAVDPDGGNLTYEWSAPSDWMLTGEGREVEITAPDQYGASGVVEVTVTDSREATASAEVVISTNANNGPAISSLTAQPQQALKGNTIALSATASDPDGDTLNYNWSTGAMGWTLTPNGDEADLQTPDEPGESATVTLEVTDGEGKKSVASIIVSTLGNRAPQVSSVAANPTTLSPGGTGALTATATDQDGDTLSYQWTAPTGWSVQSTGKNATLTAPTQYGQSAPVEVTVTDPYGGSATGTVVVSTEKNQAPVLGSLTAQPQIVDKKGTTTVDASASDPNGDTLSYNWTVPSGWTQTGSGDSIDLEAPDQYGASGVVKLTVSDGNGGTATGTVVVSTATNQAPQLTGITANPQTVSKKGTSDLEAIASDPNGDALTYDWTMPSGWSTTGTGAQITVTAPDSYGANGVVKLTVKDGNGGTVQGNVLLSTEKNQDPVLSALTANPQQVDKQGTSTLDAIASDPNGDSLTYNWTVPSGWSQTGSGASIQVTAPDSYGARAVVQLEVTDGSGGLTRGTVVVSTDKNQSPTITSVTASPRTASPGGTTNLEVVASDPNGDALTYSWSVPAGWSQTGSGSQISLTAPNTKGLSEVVRVTVDDGNGGSAQGAVVVETTPNTAPTVNGVSASPSEVDPGGQTTVTVQASDADGDSLTYSWSVPGGWSGSSTTPSITLTAPGSYGQADSVTVDVTDGTATTTGQTVVKTRQNQPPSISSLDVAENPVLENAQTALTATASDPLGDALTYSWSLDDPAWSVTGSGANVQLQAPTGSSSVVVTLTVDDGNGLTAQTTRTVSTKTCSSGKSNCDGSSANGCEVDLASDDGNCGACGNVCSGATFCSASSCVTGPTKTDVLDTNPTQNSYLSNAPYTDKHDGGMVYSESEDRIYAIYGNDNSGRSVYKIDYINGTSTRVATLSYNRHGSHPVLDESGGYVYFPPSQYTSRLERIDLATNTRETRATGPRDGTFSRGDWKDGKLWILLDDGGLHAYDPAADSWSKMHDFGSSNGMVAAHRSSGVDEVYVWEEGSQGFYSYDIGTDSVTTLASFPSSTSLGGNGQMEFIPSAEGSQYGFIYAANGCSGTPHIYSIKEDTWHSLTYPKSNGGCNGLATYDTKRNNLLISDGSDNIWVYDY